MYEGSDDGEYWYELYLEALNPEPVVMSPVECEVGRYIYHASPTCTNLIRESEWSVLVVNNL